MKGDTNSVYDVFVRDRKRGRTERVSVGQRGVQGDGASFYPAISADGRFVAFVSVAANLVPGDTNGSLDVFVRDRAERHDRAGQRRAGWRAGATAHSGRSGVDLGRRPLRRVRVPGREPRAGRQQRPRRRVRPRPPARHHRTGQRRAGRGAGRRAERLRRCRRSRRDGRFVAFAVLRDQPRRGTTPTAGRHLRPRPLSGHGRGGDGREALGRTAMRSRIGRAVALGGDPGAPCRPRRRRDDGAGERRAGGAQAETCGSCALVRSRRTGASSPSTSEPPTSSRATPTAELDVFVRDRQPGTTERVSVGPGGVQADSGSGSSLAISADGRFVAFSRTPRTSSRATPTAAATSSSATARRARPSGSASDRAASRRRQRQRRPPSISADGRFVAFSSARPTSSRTTPTSVGRLRPRPARHDRAGERRVGRRPGQRWQRSARRSRPTGASSPSSPTPPTSSRATPTARTTSSSATARPGRPSGSASGRAARRATATATSPAISRRRALRRLLVGRHEPRPGRHQRCASTSSSATASRAPPSGSASGRAAPRPTAAAATRVDLGGRALRRLRLGRHQPRPGRHQRRADVFVRDRQTGTTERVSVGPRGRAGERATARRRAISADGRFVGLRLGRHQPRRRTTPTA